VSPLSTADARLALTNFSYSCDEAWNSRVAVDPIQSYGLCQLPPDTKDLLSLHSSQRILAVDLLNHRASRFAWILKVVLVS
jgi:hypothetical protein